MIFDRHSGAMRRTGPGISRFRVRARAPRNDDRLMPGRRDMRHRALTRASIIFKKGLLFDGLPGQPGQDGDRRAGNAELAMRMELPCT